MAKFNRQQTIEDDLNHKLKSAERSYTRELAALNAPAPPQHPKTKQPEPEPDPEEEKDGPLVESLKIGYQAPKNKVLQAAIAGSVVAMLVGGVSAHYLGFFDEEPLTDPVSEIAQAETDANTAADAATPELAGATPEARPGAKRMTGVFGEWDKRQRSDRILQNQVVKLIEADMPDTASGLVSRVQDPLLKIYGQHHIVRQRGLIDETKAVLKNSAAAISGLKHGSHKVAACLSLATTLHSLDLKKSAQKAFDSAIEHAGSLENSQQQTLAQIAIANYMTAHGGAASGLISFEKAALAAENSSPVDPELNSSGFRLIAQNQMAAGLTEEALKTVESITDQGQYIETQMYIANLMAAQQAASIATADTGRSSGQPHSDTMVANEEFYADDPDLRLLFENDRKFKESVAKLPIKVNN